MRQADVRRDMPSAGGERDDMAEGGAPRIRRAQVAVDGSPADEAHPAVALEDGPGVDTLGRDAELLGPPAGLAVAIVLAPAGDHRGIRPTSVRVEGAPARERVEAFARLTRAEQRVAL